MATAADKKGFGGTRPRVPPVMSDDADAIVKGLKAAGGGRTRKASQTSRARSSRAQETRNGSGDLHPDSEAPWAPPESLKAPDARPGYRQKWMRVATFGKDDVQNVSRKMREGWLPRQASTVPKKFHAPTIRSGSFAGCIGIEGMVLVEMSEKRVKERNAHYGGMASKMAADIERNIQRINNAVPQHGGFGRVQKQASTRVLTHAQGEIEGD